MRKIAILTVLTLASVSPASAQGFLDIPVQNSWTRVRDGAVTQWSIITTTRPDTRIDFISYIEDGVRTSYYLVRSLCPSGGVTKNVVKPNDKIGMGLDCDGNIATSTSTVIDEAPTLPTEALELLGKH